MAKVRVQARPSDDEPAAAEALADAVEKGEAPSFAAVTKENGKPPSSKPVSAKRAPKYSGALDVLRKVLKEQGIAGWYQVSASRLSFALIIP